MNEKIEAIISHTDTEVKGFFAEYRWLSNFELSLISFEGLLYSSTENAYQAAKTLDKEQRKKFLTITPAEAKKLGRKIVVREDWEDVKLAVMREVCERKFNDNEALKLKLLATGDKYLEETNYWKDIFWGVCEGKGQNNLGKILMSIRTNLQNI